jgi:hypothetical protein
MSIDLDTIAQQVRDERLKQLIDEQRSTTVGPRSGEHDLLHVCVGDGYEYKWMRRSPPFYPLYCSHLTTHVHVL